MGLVKTRLVAAMQKQQRAKAGMNPSMVNGGCEVLLPWVQRRVKNISMSAVDLLRCHCGDRIAR